MAAATIAIRKRQEENGAGDAKEEEVLMEKLRSRIPTKEFRDAELFLNVLVLG